jgi:hypothetical protein
MKIKEIYISEAGLLSRMMPAGVQQFMANRRSQADTKTLSDAAWKQWINRVPQITRSLGVRSANDIPPETYAEYLKDFVENSMLRYELDRYDAGSKQRIEAVINKIAQVRNSSGQVRKLFQDLGTQAVGSREDPQSRNRFSSFKGLGFDPGQEKMLGAIKQMVGPNGQQPAGQQPQAAQSAQPQAAQPATARAAGGWVDAGQGLYLKPATSTTPTMASYRKNVFSLNDQGQWLDARDRPVTQTWQAFLNQSLGAIEQIVAPAAGQEPAQRPQTAPAAQPASPQPKPITVTDKRGTVWSYKDSDRKWYSPEGEPVDDPEDIKKLNQQAKVQFQNRAMATQK